MRCCSLVLKALAVLWVRAHIYIAPDIFGRELHLCLCCQYTWQWPGVTQSFHPSGPSTPRWVNYLAAEPGIMQKPAELDQKFEPRFQNVQSRRQMFHASPQRTARFATSSSEFTPALRYKKKKNWSCVTETFRSEMGERYDLRDVGRRLSETADMVRAVLLICGYI